MKAKKQLPKSKIKIVGVPKTKKKINGAR